MHHAMLRGRHPEPSGQSDRYAWNKGRAVMIDGKPENEVPWVTCNLAEFYRWMDKWYPGWREEHTR